MPLLARARIISPLQLTFTQAFGENADREGMNNITQGETIMKTVQVLTHRLPEALKVIDRLMKKANKYGNSPITYEVKGAEIISKTQEIKTDDGVMFREVNVSVTTIEFSGEAPKVAGYAFLGKVEFIQGGGVLLQSLKTTEIPESFRTNNNGHCDHCKMDRRRKDVYILQHEETGAYIQVGRTCLHDFLGLDVPENVLGRFELVKALDERLDGFGGFGAGFAQSLQNYLECASFAIRNFGWCSSQSADYGLGKTATRDMVEILLDWKNPLHKEYEFAMQEQAEKSRLEAEQVIAWVRNDLQPVGNYQNNLKSIFAEDLFYEPKHRGLICSAVHAYHREMEKAEEKKQVEPSSFIGELGQRVKNLEAVIKDYRSIGESMYGEKYLMKFLVNGKDIAVWFTTSQMELCIGATVKITGTVKHYSEYQGIKQTTLSRVKVA